MDSPQAGGAQGDDASLSQEAAVAARPESEWRACEKETKEVLQQETQE